LSSRQDKHLLGTELKFSGAFMPYFKYLDYTAIERRYTIHWSEVWTDNLMQNAPGALESLPDACNFKGY